MVRPHANVWYSLSMMAKHEGIELLLGASGSRMFSAHGFRAGWTWMGGLADRL